MKLKPLDLIISILVIISIVIYIIDTLKPEGFSSNFYVESQGKKYVYPIESNENLEFEGVIGKTVIRIKDKKAFITHSDCRDKVCIEMGHVHKSGQFAACLPNKIILGVEGDSEDRDGITY